MISDELDSNLSLKIKQTLEWCYILNKDIAENESVRPQGRIEASRVMVENQVNVWHLLKRGPSSTNA